MLESIVLTGAITLVVIGIVNTLVILEVSRPQRGAKYFEGIAPVVGILFRDSFYGSFCIHGS